MYVWTYNIGITGAVTNTNIKLEAGCVVYVAPEVLQVRRYWHELKLSALFM